MCAVLRNTLAIDKVRKYRYMVYYMIIELTEEGTKLLGLLRLNPHYW